MLAHVAKFKKTSEAALVPCGANLRDFVRVLRALEPAQDFLRRLASNFFDFNFQNNIENKLIRYPWTLHMKIFECEEDGDSCIIVLQFQIIMRGSRFFVWCMATEKRQNWYFLVDSDSDSPIASSFHVDTGRFGILLLACSEGFYVRTFPTMSLSAACLLHVGVFLDCLVVRIVAVILAVHLQGTEQF